MVTGAAGVPERGGAMGPRACDASDDVKRLHEKTMDELAGQIAEEREERANAVSVERQERLAAAVERQHQMAALRSDLTQLVGVLTTTVQTVVTQMQASIDRIAGPGSGPVAALPVQPAKPARKSSPWFARLLERTQFHGVPWWFWLLLFMFGYQDVRDQLARWKILDPSPASITIGSSPTAGAHP
jgi:hypothetical protein